MRIALVCTEKLPVPPVRGGAIQTYIDGVLPFLAARHDVTVVGRADPALPPEEGRGAPGSCGWPRRSARRHTRTGRRFLAAERWGRGRSLNRPAFVERIARAAPAPG